MLINILLSIFLVILFSWLWAEGIDAMKNKQKNLKEPQ